MRHFRSAFTILELLLVLGITAVLAALLLPTLVSVKNASDKTTCVSHQHTISQAALLYTNDYDDRFTLMNQNTQEPRSSRNDHTWVQLLLPYSNHFGSFRCPSDDGRRDIDAWMFDQDLVPGDLTSRYYTASMRSDAGLNYLALAPQVLVNGLWLNDPKTYTQIAAPSNTVMLVDSAWTVDAEGRAVGGGNWLVDPPCRFALAGSRVLDIFQAPSYPGNPLKTINGEWTTPNGNEPYGGAWPWHQGRMNVTRVDGSIASETPNELSGGCDVQSGAITLAAARGNYVWSSGP